jgi:hypothetical protein
MRLVRFERTCRISIGIRSDAALHKTEQKGLYDAGKLDSRINQ